MIYEKKTGFENDINITEDEIYEKILPFPKNKENIGNYIVTLNNAINDGILHYWEWDDDNDPDPYQIEYNLRIPFWDNYIMFILHGFGKTNYEFYDYKKAIERGVGVCSQQAMLMVDFLQKNDVEAYILYLGGKHTVLTTRVNNNEWWVLDPDYGVVLKKDINILKKNPEYIINQYKNKFGNKLSDEQYQDLKDIYTKEEIKICDKESECYKYLERMRYREYLYYKLIWIFPIFFIFPFLLSLKKGTNT
jgi:hypothetical protein